MVVDITLSTPASFVIFIASATTKELLLIVLPKFKLSLIVVVPVPEIFEVKLPPARYKLAEFVIPSVAFK